jgi:hypothetical protein
MVTCIARFLSRHSVGAREVARLVAILSVALEVSITHAAVIPLETCGIAIEVLPIDSLHWTQRDVERFREEAARPWIRSGVALCWRDDLRACPEFPTTYVRVTDNKPELPDAPPPARRPLGWIGFSERSGPGPFIVLSIRHTRELLGRARMGDRALFELPALRERLLPQALGRALAHELGHFLLARRAHSARGLMRPSLRPEDLADADGGPRIRLTRDDERRLTLGCGATRMAAAAGNQ